MPANFMRKLLLALLPCLAAAMFLTPAPTTVLGAKPGGGGTGGGTIYFQARYFGFASMNSDGGDKTFPPVTGGGEPSRFLHAGRRWIVRTVEFVGETYPDASRRNELFAEREDGALMVQLTADPELQIYGDVRWAPGDAAVSWIARRWLDGQVVESGVYVAELAYDNNGDIVGLVQQPLFPLVPTALVSVNAEGLVPDIFGHDWSPDGGAMVHDNRSNKELWIADLTLDASALLFQGSLANRPAWSPNGQTIAFHGASGSIQTIRIDNGRLTTLVKSSPTTSLSNPRWSPTGSHLIYTRFDNRLNGSAVFRVNADGSGAKSLTSELESAWAIAWR